MVCDVRLKENIMSLTVGKFREVASSIADTVAKRGKQSVAFEGTGALHNATDLNKTQLITDINKFITNRPAHHRASDILDTIVRDFPDSAMAKFLGTSW